MNTTLTTFNGIRTDQLCTITIDGRPLSNIPGPDPWTEAPVSWGGLSHGTQTLAFAILYECCDHDIAEGYFEEFASDYIAALPDSWEITLTDVEAWLTKTWNAAGLAQQVA